MRLLVATTNAGKLREIARVLRDVPVELVSLRDLPAVPEPEETGATFQDNARAKALYYDAHLAERARADYTVAEDSGLFIDALGGEPGVHSARYLRPDASYPERFAEIYRRLAAASATASQAPPRTARFVCALAVARGGHVVYEAKGMVEGEVAPAPRGDRGFGYDPIFYYPPYRRTLAEVTEEDKLRVAHRGQAFSMLAAWLQSAGETKNGER